MLDALGGITHLSTCRRPVLSHDNDVLQTAESLHVLYNRQQQAPLAVCGTHLGRIGDCSAAGDELDMSIPECSADSSQPSDDERDVRSK